MDPVLSLHLSNRPIQSKPNTQNPIRCPKDVKYHRARLSSTEPNRRRLLEKRKQSQRRGHALPTKAEDQQNKHMSSRQHPAHNPAHSPSAAPDPAAPPYMPFCCCCCSGCCGP
jgi:hypothetical protein